MMFFRRTTPRKKQRPLHTTPAFNSGISGVLEPLEPRLLLSGTHFIVNTLTDSPLNGDDNLLTLREAIEAANSNLPLGANLPAGSALDVDIITFNLPALQTEAGGQPLTITLNGTELEITDSLTIQGPTAGSLAIDADGLSRVLYIPGRFTTVNISNLTITGGNARTDGGGIYNVGIMSLSNSIVSNNSLSRWDYKGGGIYNRGTLTITQSTISHNSMREGRGAGIANVYSTLTIADSIVSGNIIEDHGAGGGIYFEGGTFIITNSIVSNNHSSSAGGIMLYYGAQGTLNNSTITGNYRGILSYGLLTINNSIVANNQSYDISGAYTQNNSLVNMDPRFVRNPSPGPDGIWATSDDDYGDLHLTDSSLAINLGDNARALDHQGLPLTTDFDNNPRIIDGQVDAGAYEFAGSPSPLIESYSSVVTTLDDITNSTDGLISLREALYYANQLAILDITFAPSFNAPTFTLNGNPLQFIHSATIDATPLGGLTINANQQSRIVTISRDTQVSFIGLTLTDANDSAISNGGTLSLVDSLITNNSGGIANFGGTITLTNSPITNNHSTTDNKGGGIYNYNGTITLTNSPVTGNSTNDVGVGGGIFNDGSNASITLINSPITDNFAPIKGGGIYNQTAKLTLINSPITGNSTSKDGGGIYVSYGKVTLINSPVSNNTATKNGGGVYGRGCTMTLTNLSVTGNSASGNGGGFYNDSSTIVLTNLSVSGNSTTGDGGGIYNTRTVRINNSTIAGNSAQNGGGIYNTESLTLNNSIISINVAPNAPDIQGDYTNNSSLITTDPQFIRNPSPGPDGLWATEDDDLGDLRLQPNSPAINTGDNTLLPPDTTDLDNDSNNTEPLPRDLDNNPRVNGGTVDIGAYESQYFLPADYNGDESIDIIDADLLSAAINTNSPFDHFDLNNDNIVDLLDGQYLIQNTLNTHPADFDLNYQVDVADLSTWATGFGKTSAVYSQGDANFDGQVDVADLSLWASNFGKTSSPPAPVIAPLIQSSNAVADTYILDTTTPTTPASPTSNNFLTPGLSTPGSGSGADRWLEIKNLLNPTFAANQKLDIIQGITPL